MVETRTLSARFAREFLADVEYQAFADAHVSPSALVTSSSFSAALLISQAATAHEKRTSVNRTVRNCRSAPGRLKGEASIQRRSSLRSIT